MGIVGYMPQIQNEYSKKLETKGSEGRKATLLECACHKLQAAVAGLSKEVTT